MGAAPSLGGLGTVGGPAPLYVRLLASAAGWRFELVTVEGLCVFRSPLEFDDERGAHTAGEVARTAMNLVREAMVPELDELARLRRVERAAKGFLGMSGPGLREHTPEGRALTAALGCDGTDQGCADLDCRETHRDLLATARSFADPLLNIRDRLADAAVAAIREQEREWRRLLVVGGMDPGTWSAAKDLRDADLRDLLAALGEAL